MSYHAAGCDCWDCYMLRGSASVELVQIALQHAEKARGELSGKSLERMGTVIGLLKRIIEDGGK